MHWKGRDLRAVRQAVGGGCQSGWGRLPSVANAIEPGTCYRGTVAGHRLGTLEGGVPPDGMSHRGYLHPFQCIPGARAVLWQ